MDDGSDWEALPRYGLSHQGIDSTWECTPFLRRGGCNRYKHTSSST